MTKEAIFWYDLETTGIRPNQHGIHQLAALFEVDGEIVKKINIKMKPVDGKVIDEGAFTFCGLKSDILNDYQTAEEGFKEFKEAFNEFKDIKFKMAGFNSKNFDNKFLRQFIIDFDAQDLAREFFSGEQLDVLLEYKKMLGEYTPISMYNKAEDPSKLPEEFRTQNMKLETLANNFDIEIKAHDGLSDIEATKRLYEEIIKNHKKS